MATQDAEVDFEGPDERMSSLGLMKWALGEVEMIRDTHWSDKDRIGIHLDDDHPTDPGSIDRLVAAQNVIKTIEILIARDNDRPVSADQISQMFDQICAVHSISSLLRSLDFDYFDEGSLSPTFGLFADLTADAMVTASNVYLEKEHAGGAS